MKLINLIENRFSKLYNETLNSNIFVKKACFFVGLTSILLYNFLDYNLILFTKRTSNFLLYLGIILLVLKILLTRETLFTYLKYLIYILMAIVCDNVVGSGFILLTAILYMISSKEINIKSIFRYLFVFNSIILITSMFIYFMNQFISCNILGLYTNKYIYRGNTIRHNFYFYHPNAFSFYLFWTYIIYIYLHWDSYNLKNILILLLFSILFAVFCYIVTQTRIASVLFLMSVPLLMLFKNRKLRKNEIFELLTTSTYLIMFSISFMLLIFYNQNNIFGVISQGVNNLLSGRIELGHTELLDKGISLLGNNISYFNNSVIDNGYYHILINYGILFSLFFCFIFFKTSYKLYEHKDFKSLYVLVIFCLYNFVESLLVHPQASIVYGILGMFI